MSHIGVRFDIHSLQTHRSVDVVLNATLISSQGLAEDESVLPPASLSRELVSSPTPTPRKGGTGGGGGGVRGMAVPPKFRQGVTHISDEVASFAIKLNDFG